MAVWWKADRRRNAGAPSVNGNHPGLSLRVIRTCNTGFKPRTFARPVVCMYKSWRARVKPTFSTWRLVHLFSFYPLFDVHFLDKRHVHETKKEANRKESGQTEDTRWNVTFSILLARLDVRARARTRAIRKNSAWPWSRYSENLILLPLSLASKRRRSVSRGTRL